MSKRPDSNSSPFLWT